MKIPLGLLKMTDNKRFVEVDARDVRTAIEALESLYPGMWARFYDDQGNLKGYVRVYVNKKDVRGLQGDRTVLSAGDEVILLPALSGG